MNERIGRENVEAAAACTSRGEITTRVNKSGVGVDADRGQAKDREQSGRWERGRQLETIVEWENSAGFIHNVGPPGCSSYGVVWEDPPGKFRAK